MVPAGFVGRDSSTRDASALGRARTPKPEPRGRGRVRSSEATRVDCARRFGCRFRVGLVYFVVKYVPVRCDGSSRLENCEVCVTKMRGCFVFSLFLFIARLIDDDAVVVFVLECPPIFRSLSTGIEEFLSDREPSGPREFEIVVVTETFPVRLTLCIEGFFE